MLIKSLCRAAHVLMVKGLGWKITGERPPEKKVMILGAPHTSTLDFFLTLALIHHFDLPLRYLIKDNVFKGPMAPLLRSLGGIPVNRRQANKLVVNLIAVIKEQDEMTLGVLPEGTRKYVEYWKSGFYYIALGAEIPIYPVKVDGVNKQLEMGPRMTVTGDIVEDVALLADFFGDTKGVRPENGAPVRVRPPNPSPQVES